MALHILKAEEDLFSAFQDPSSAREKLAEIRTSFYEIGRRANSLPVQFTQHYENVDWWSLGELGDPEKINSFRSLEDASEAVHKILLPSYSAFFDAGILDLAEQRLLYEEATRKLADITNDIAERQNKVRTLAAFSVSLIIGYFVIFRAGGPVDLLEHIAGLLFAAPIGIFAWIGMRERKLKGYYLDFFHHTGYSSFALYEAVMINLYRASSEIEKIYPKKLHYFGWISLGASILYLIVIGIYIRVR